MSEVLPIGTRVMHPVFREGRVIQHVCWQEQGVDRYGRHMVPVAFAMCEVTIERDKLLTLEPQS